MSHRSYRAFFPHYIGDGRARSRARRRLIRMAIMLILLSAVCSILIAPFWFIYKPPGLLIRYLQHQWPDVLWRVSTSAKVIALTIDDGPSEYTNEIMQILISNGATATFFIIGSQVAGHEETLQDLIRNGNELGNHGTSFPQRRPRFSVWHICMESCECLTSSLAPSTMSRESYFNSQKNNY